MPASAFYVPTKYFHVWRLQNSQANQSVRLFSTSRPNRIATIYAPSTNTGVYYFGDADVTPADFSFTLHANGSFVTYIDDLSKIFYIGTVNGDNLRVMVEWGYADSDADYQLQQQPLNSSNIGPIDIPYDTALEPTEFPEMVG